MTTDNLMPEIKSCEPLPTHRIIQWELQKTILLKSVFIRILGMYPMRKHYYLILIVKVRKYFRIPRTD